MAIQTPSFNVPALSPAGLLADRGGPSAFDRALERGMDLYAQEQRDARALAAQRELTQMNIDGSLTRDILGALNSNELMDYDPNTMNLTLPGEEVPLPIQRVQGPAGTPYAGRTFATRASVDRARAEVEMAAPVTTLFGREVRDGLTVRDTMGPGGGQLPTDHLKGMAKGNLDAYRQAYEALPDNQPEAKAAVKALIDAAEADGFVSLLEEEGVKNALRPTDAASISHTSRILYQMDRQEAGAIAETRRVLNQNFQIFDPTSANPHDRSRRSLTPAEARVVALYENGFEGQLTPEELEQAQAIQGMMVPRIGPPQVVEEITQWVSNSGSPGNPENADFVASLYGHLTDGDGKIHEHLIPVAREIIGAAAVRGRIDRPDLTQWASSPASRTYRAAWGLYDMGYGTRKMIYDLINSGADHFPFGLTGPNGAMSKMEMLWPDTFNDVPEQPVYGRTGLTSEGEVGGRGGTGEPSEWESWRGQYESGLIGAGRRELQGARAALARGDRENIANTFQAIGAGHDRAARTTRNPEIKANEEKMHAYWNEIANIIATDADWEMFVDSVALPSTESALNRLQGGNR